MTSSSPDRPIGDHYLPRICWALEVRISVPKRRYHLTSAWLRYIADWQKVFRHFDRDQSGSIEGTELAAALRQFGYSLNPTLLSLIEQKYGKRCKSDIICWLLHAHAIA